MPKSIDFCESCDVLKSCPKGEKEKIREPLQGCDFGSMALKIAPFPEL